MKSLRMNKSVGLIVYFGDISIYIKYTLICNIKVYLILTIQYYVLYFFWDLLRWTGTRSHDHTKKHGRSRWPTLWQGPTWIENEHMGLLPFLMSIESRGWIIKLITAILTEMDFLKTWNKFQTEKDQFAEVINHNLNRMRYYLWTNQY